MQEFKKILSIFAILIIILSFSRPCPEAFGNTCASGVAVPPFLGSSSTPNLLIMIDNSASMYDLAYINESNPEGCYDDTYQSIQSYAGYFKPDKWYAYGFGSQKFFEITDAAAATIKSAATYTSYIVNDPADAADDSDGEDALIIINAVPAVTAFAAKGNFLNWATASKLDIEKRILTGGKYDPALGAIVMESRGCLNRRMIKKIAVKDSTSNDFYLTLGIIPPSEKRFNPWEDGVVYAAGSIVSDVGNLYITAAGGTSSGTGVADDTGVVWVLYTLTRWTNGTFYPAGSIVTDPAKLNTLDEGTLYITKTGGTTNGTGVADDTGITDWTTYNTTHIEIFPVTATGFDNTACQQAIDEMAKASPNQGQLKQYIDDCMGYSSAIHGVVSDKHAAFNHSIHNCWYEAKNGSWPPGSGPVQSIKPACEAIYTAGIDPWDITTDDRGYACYGVYNADPLLKDGYVGRCWIPAGPAVWTCIKYDKFGNCTKWGWVGGTGGSWESDACIEDALMDYCGVMEIPEVIDPTDQAGETGEFWNLPAVLIDSGVVAQIGQPLAVMKGHINSPTAPEGMLKDFADVIRMGVMVFNDNGSKTECASADPHILYECYSENRDGGKVVVYIDQGAAHTTALINAINKIKANSWTPMAEAYYTGMKYYTQDNTDLLNDDLASYAANPDFWMDATHPDPIVDPCQANNILIITDGASTADLATDVENFTSTAGQNDTDTSEATACTGSGLSASTHLDDLAYYLYHENEHKIRTHIVVAGTPRSSGTGDECSPDVLLTDTATNGGTTLSTATNMTQLEAKLRETFDIIRAGASAGSAASVISSSRGGEGAIYQAIFWPEINLPVTADPVNWAGEVHALFIDTYGQMYEDTNGNRMLDENDQSVIIYFDENLEDTKACYGTMNTDGTCNGTSTDIRQVKYLWSATEWLSGITDADILVNRIPAKYISEENKRYIFTWEDLDNDGIVGAGEQMSFEARDWAALATAGGRGPATLDFGVQTSAEANAIVNWSRGLDQAGLRNRRLLYDFDLDGTESLFTWRLGDVIHSTPVSAAAPQEGYHLLYKDASYGNFVSQYQRRRHVIFFGGNDGMMHAVNGGFYSTTEKKFLKTPDGTAENTAPELGAELWAYVPYNLLIHLKCLTNPNYDHKYYVDQRPRLFDVKIFTDDADHPGGWGTILVGSMRFGGAPVDVNQLDLDNNSVADYPADTRRFTSAYFILDVTNPENPPVLLGELTMNGSETDMGYTTVIPTMVPMKEGSVYKWYLVMGSGPTDVNGESTMNGKVAVFPLDLLTSATPSAFRITSAAPTAANNYVGSWTAPVANSFASSMITVDFELKEDYRADVVYFGSVEGTFATSWGGKLYRLVTRKLDAGGNQVTSTPDEWFINTLIDVNDPITAEPTAGWDGIHYWVFFGTGRFFSSMEKTDVNQQAFYGIKEPLDCNGEFTWATVEKTGTPDSLPGSQGLLQVDKILIKPTTATAADIVCKDADPDCLALVASGVTTFSALEEYINGSGCLATDPTGTDGWYREFPYDKERNLGQGALLGGLLTFTTFKPFDDPCLPEGYSYLYGIYLKTGTSWYKAVFENIIGNQGLDDDGNIIDIVPIGRGMSTTPNLHVGKSEGSKAFIQTSTGAIIEIPQVNLPVDVVKTGRANWIELSD